MPPNPYLFIEDLHSTDLILHFVSKVLATLSNLNHFLCPVDLSNVKVNQLLINTFLITKSFNALEIIS